MKTDRSRAAKTSPAADEKRLAYARKNDWLKHRKRNLVHQN